MLEIVLRQLATVAEDISIVGGDDRGYGRFGTRVIADRYPGGAALGGIATAISAAKHRYCLVVACDMPFLNPRLLQRMAEEPRTYDVLVPAISGESRQGRGLVYQTLHAIYSRSCLEAIGRQLLSDDLRVAGFFPFVTLKAIDENEIRSFDPQLLSFFNANSPQSLAAARSIVCESGGVPNGTP